MKIPLTAEIRAYSLSVAQVGERMRLTGDRFGDVSSRRVASLEDIKRMKNDYETLLGEFVSQKETLEQLNVPTQLIDEHNRLIKSYSKYVDATELGIKLLDTEKYIANEDASKKAQELQLEASKEIVQVSNEIAVKLGIK